MASENYSGGITPSKCHVNCILMFVLFIMTCIKWCIASRTHSYAARAAIMCFQRTIKSHNVDVSCPNLREWMFNQCNV